MIWVNEHYIASAFIASFLVAIIFMSLTFCLQGYVTSNERVVLAFVGVLATFVVLTNHAQAAERIRILEEMLKDTETTLNKTIEIQKKENQEQLRALIDDKTSRHMSRTFNFIQACQDRDSYQLATAIFNDVKNKTNKTYKVITKGQEEISANIAITKSLILFVSTKADFRTIPHNNIQMVENYKFDYEKMSTIVFILKQLDEKDNINQ